MIIGKRERVANAGHVLDSDLACLGRVTLHCGGHARLCVSHKVPVCRFYSMVDVATGVQTIRHTYQTNKTPKQFQVEIGGVLR